MSTPVVFDCEVYSNYFLLMMRNIETGKTVHYELYDGVEFPTAKVLTLLRKYQLISFNGRRFDMPLLMMACYGETCERIKEACDAIIVENLKHWSAEFTNRFPDSHHGTDEFDHIDLIEVAPGQASLKIYGGRMHSKRMQDLPIEPSAKITPEQRQQLIAYCGNDLQTTVDLFNVLRPQIDLRTKMTEHYGIDLRSKSDAQIAEAVIRRRVQDLLGKRIEYPDIRPGTTFRYSCPDFIGFETEPMREALSIVLDSEFRVAANGSVEMPERLEKTNIVMGRSVYRMGIGGLHSTEECAAHIADGCRLVDRDVTSYYPSVILKLHLAPKQMGREFLDVYRSIVHQRIEAKHAGDKVVADSLKIVLNGSFGKFGSKWSTLYSPALLIQTTITGQLSLLMLIEFLEVNGIPVVSANTDGVVIKCPAGRDDDMERIVWVWEQITGFETEATEYDAIYSRDVNNYVALKHDGKVKLKGVFAPAGLAKNAANEICTDAAVALLTSGTPVEESIRGCRDIRKFVTIRRVNGGAVKGDHYLGKAVRWYYAKGETGSIHYKTNGYRVARSEGGKPLMDLPDEMPDDVDHDWYIRETESILAGVGYAKG